MTFRPDIPGAMVVPDNNFWPGRMKKWPITSVVQHYTAGGNGRSIAKWLASKNAKASTHVLICRDGSIIQQVRFSDRAFHAGEKMSVGLWKGVSQPVNVNHFSIGIENSNYGWLELDENSYLFHTRGGKPYTGPSPIKALDHLGQERWWEPFTDKLIEANIAVLKQVASEYEDVVRENVVAHSSVSPLRKYDPGPLWPAEYVLDAVFGSRATVISGTGNLSADDPAPDDDYDQICVLGRGNNGDGDEEILE